MEILYYIFLLIGGGILAGVLAVILALLEVVLIVSIGGWMATLNLRFSARRRQHVERSPRSAHLAEQEKDGSRHAIFPSLRTGAEGFRKAGKAN